jgi:hypothetical protein
MAVRIIRLGTGRLPDEGLRIGTVRRPPRGWAPRRSQIRLCLKELLRCLVAHACPKQVRRTNVWPRPTTQTRPRDIQYLDLVILHETTNFVGGT